MHVPPTHEDAALKICMASTGIYLAYLTTVEQKPIYPGYKTIVNDRHTKVGIARLSFQNRERQYMHTFNREVVFLPVLEMVSGHLKDFEARLLAQLVRHYPRSGRAREWFHTVERQAIAELVLKVNEDFRID